MSAGVALMCLVTVDMSADPVGRCGSRSALGRGHEPVQSVMIAVVCNVGPYPRGPEDLGRADALPVGVLDHDEPAGSEQPAGGALDGAYDIQAVRAGPECDGRVVVAYLGLHRCQLAGRHVGRIAGDQVEL